MFGSLKINNDTPAMPDMLTFTFEMMIPSTEPPPLSLNQSVLLIFQGD